MVSTAVALPRRGDRIVRSGLDYQLEPCELAGRGGLLFRDGQSDNGGDEPVCAMVHVHQGSLSLACLRVLPVCIGPCELGPGRSSHPCDVSPSFLGLPCGFGYRAGSEPS
jgi:hypothetical protein